MMPRLAIAVPTYDRNARLSETLQLLLPQLPLRDTPVYILDNHSPTPVADTLADLEGAGSCRDLISIRRNAANIGLSANVIRCFEVTEDADWIWVLGDDDPPMPNAVEMIYARLEEMKREADSTTICHLKFDSCYAPPTKATARINCVDALATTLGNKDNYSNFLFLSSGVYHRHAFLRFLATGYRTANTLAPHIAMLLECVADGGRVLRHPGELVTTRRVGGRSSWDHLSLQVGFQSFLDYDAPLAFQYRAMPKLMRNYAGHRPYRDILRHIIAPEPRSEAFWVAYGLKTAVIIGGVSGLLRAAVIVLALGVAKVPGVRRVLKGVVKPRATASMARS
jgi:glycosyltransferase involved in cell wall biosynthesis